MGTTPGLGEDVNSAFVNVVNTATMKVVRGVVLTRSGLEERVRNTTILQEILKWLPADLYRQCLSKVPPLPHQNTHTPPATLTLTPVHASRLTALSSKACSVFKHLKAHSNAPIQHEFLSVVDVPETSLLKMKFSLTLKSNKITFSIRTSLVLKHQRHEHCQS